MTDNWKPNTRGFQARRKRKLNLKPMTNKKVNVAGLSIPVVSDEKAEECTYLICTPWGSPSPFDDNLKGICSHCGIDVQYRWHAPRKPKRLCMDCFIKLESKVVVESEETKRELEP